MTWMIEVDQLVKRFGPLTAVDGVSFNVGQGEVLGFLGPNGAGKSTTMKMITGFLAPSAGSIRVCGHDVSAEPIAAKAAIGYLPEGAPAYPDMTPRTFLNFVCDVRGLAGEERRRQLDYVIENVHLESVWEQPIETLSKGFNRRVGLAQAILHDPPVLILDEPTDGLDPNQKHEVRTLIREMAREKAIIISTHILEEVEAVCSRAVVIAGGRIVADGTPDELAARAPTYNAVLLVTPAEHVERALRENVPGIGRIERLGEQHYRVYPLDGGPIIADVSDFVRSQRWPVAELTVEPPRLDEVFRRITTGEEASAGSRGAGSREAA